MRFTTSDFNDPGQSLGLAFTIGMASKALPSVATTGAEFALERVATVEVAEIAIPAGLESLGTAALLDPEPVTKVALGAVLVIWGTYEIIQHYEVIRAYEPDEPAAPMPPPLPATVLPMPPTVMPGQYVFGKGERG